MLGGTDVQVCTVGAVRILVVTGQKEHKMSEIRVAVRSESERRSFGKNLATIVDVECVG